MNLHELLCLDTEEKIEQSNTLNPYDLHYGSRRNLYLGFP